MQAWMLTSGWQTQAPMVVWWVKGLRVMTIQLPEDIENSIIAKVHSGLFPSVDAAMTEAARLLLERLEQGRPPRKPPLTEEEFKQQLVDAGLMTSLPTPLDPAMRQPFQPVKIEGEPLSETIIRERR